MGSVFLRMATTNTELASVRPLSVECVFGMEDLFLEILVRLPVKSVTRLKLVSKQWLSLISDLKFVRAYFLKNHGTRPLGMFVDHQISDNVDFFWLDNDGEEETPDHDLTLHRSSPSLHFIASFFPDLKEKVQVLKSCNGLFLCCTEYPASLEHLCVCNPTTKQCRFLPRITSESKRPSVYGFAYDPSISHHYKVVCIKYRDRDVGFAFQVEVYSSEDHQWRIVLQSEYPKFGWLHDSVFYDGGIHWEGDHYFHFDLRTETLVRRPWLPYFGGFEYHNDFGVLAGRWGKYWCMVTPSDGYLHVFVLARVRDKYMQWVIKHKVNVSHLTSAYPEIFTTETFNGRFDVECAVYALGAIEGTKEDDSTLLLAIPDKIISYNFIRNTVKTVYNFPATYFEIVEVITFPWIETLAPV